MPCRAIDVKTLLRRKITRFQSCFGGPPIGTLTLAEFRDEVRGDKWKAPIEEIRHFEANGKSDEAQRRKLKLPVVKVAGEFAGPTSKDLLRHSGLILLDLDNLGTEVNRVAEALKLDPLVIASFRSPRGNGLKVLIAAEAHDEASHRACFAAAKEYFDSRLNLPSEARIDPASGSPSSNCFLSHDRAAWWREEGTVQPLSTTTEVIQTPQSPNSAETEQKKEEKEEILSCTSVSHVSGLRSSHQQRARERQAAEMLLEALPRPLREIYSRWIDNRRPIRGARHDYLLRTIPGALHVVSIPVLHAFLVLHHDLHVGTWSTSREKHLAEIDRLIRDVENRFLGSLPDAAREFYQAASETQRAAFRICRDLARRKNGEFFLSCPSLAPRLGQASRPLGGGHCNTAKRALTVLTCEGFLAEVRRGERLSTMNAGQRLRATEWRWCDDPAPPNFEVTTTQPCQLPPTKVPVAQP